MLKHGVKYTHILAGFSPGMGLKPGGRRDSIDPGLGAGVKKEEDK